MSSLLQKIIPERQTLLAYTIWWTVWCIEFVIVLHRLSATWPEALVDSLVSITVFAIAGFVVSNTYRFYSPSVRNFVILGGYVLLLALISANLQVFAVEQIFDGLGWTSTSAMPMPVRMMVALLLIAFMAILHLFRSRTNEQEEILKRKEEAEKISREAELSKLRQQLQPHFLFNSLNSISALTASRPEEARRMIQQLSEFLRGTLKKDEQQLVSLKEEIHHLNLYLEIEKVRFGHRLQTQITGDERSNGMKLPSLLLQPIVENAVKFALYDTIGEITISIHATVEGNMLVIRITNPFDSATSKPNNGTGFGLNSIHRRLYLTYGRQDLLETNASENIFTTTVKIPQQHD